MTEAMNELSKLWLMSFHLDDQLINAAQEFTALRHKPSAFRFMWKLLGRICFSLTLHPLGQNISLL